MSLLYIIEDEPVMADCLAASLRSLSGNTLEVEVFNDAISALEGVNHELPDVILLDVMLSGPDGFTFLNEMISYHDTARVPVVLVSSLDITPERMEHYGIVAVLKKTKMTPADVYDAIQKALSTPLAPRPAPVPPSSQTSVTSADQLNQKLAASRNAEIIADDK